MVYLIRTATNFGAGTARTSNDSVCVGAGQDPMNRLTLGKWWNQEMAERGGRVDGGCFPSCFDTSGFDAKNSCVQEFKGYATESYMMNAKVIEARKSNKTKTKTKTTTTTKTKTKTKTKTNTHTKKQKQTQKQKQKQTQKQKQKQKHKQKQKQKQKHKQK